MNTVLKILLVLIPLVIILIVIICNLCNKSYLINIDNSVVPLKFNYLTITEDDLNYIDIPTRWLYRSECLKYFKNFKNDYAIKNYRYPLPRSLENGLIFVNLASYRDPECPRYYSRV